jgi:hypothetical protein
MPTLPAASGRQSRGWAQGTRASIALYVEVHPSGVPGARVIGACVAVAAGALTGTAALAHGFGRASTCRCRVAGDRCRADVVLSFAMVIDFLPARFERLDYPRLDLLRWGAFRPHATRAARTGALRERRPLRLTIVAGLIGDPIRRATSHRRWCGGSGSAWHS